MSICEQATSTCRRYAVSLPVKTTGASSSVMVTGLLAIVTAREAGARCPDLDTRDHAPSDGRGSPGTSRTGQSFCRYQPPGRQRHGPGKPAILTKGSRALAAPGGDLPYAH